MEKQFQEEINEAPYVAKMKSMLAMSYRFPACASQVFEHLYLGAEEDASNIGLLDRLGITHVINCAATYINTGPNFYGSSQKYMEFHAEDDDDYNILQHFNAVYDFIEEARQTGGKVLIHCIMGINRSGALTVAYCMVHKNMGPISAARFVQKQRSMVLSNEGFQQQIIIFARQRGLLDQDRDEIAKV
jgi:hypothetical protein